LLQEFLLRAADRVFNRVLPLLAPGFSLHFKRWTRLAMASNCTLPTPVTVELRDLPAHALDKLKAQNVLSDSCSVESIFPVTATTRDISMLQVTTWTVRPESIPRVVDLLTPELT
jgi:hypothetical protein